jgi:hypothetical protein
MKAFCIVCRDADAVVCMDLDGTDVFRCLSCEEEFSRDDVQKVVDGAKVWAKLLAWADQYPKG